MISLPLRSATGSMKSNPTQHCRSLRMKRSSCSDDGTSVKQIETVTCAAAFLPTWHHRFRRPIFGLWKLDCPNSFLAFDTTYEALTDYRCLGIPRVLQPADYVISGIRLGLADTRRRHDHIPHILHNQPWPRLQEPLNHIVESLSHQLLETTSHRNGEASLSQSATEYARALLRRE